MAAPKVYRWDDANAPVLACNSTDTSKSFVGLLKACLVDGYGSKTPPGAGYSLEHESANGDAIAIKSKNVKANGFWFQIATADAYNATTGSDITFAYINMYEHMQSATTGKIGGTADSLYRIAAGSNYTDDPVPWVVVADDRFFYVFIYSDPAYRVSQSPTVATMLAESAGCAGDFISVKDDPWSSLVWGYDYGGFRGGDFGLLMQYSVNATSDYMAIKRAVTGENAAVSGVVGHGGGPVCVYSREAPMGGVAVASHPSASYSPGSALVIARPYLAEVGNNHLLRGFLPGLYYPCHDRPFNNLKEVNIAGANYLAINFRAYSGKYGQVLIKLTDWRV